MDVLILGVVQLVDQHQLQEQDGEHSVKLGRLVEHSVLEDVSEDHDLVQEDQLTQVDGGLARL